MAVAQGPDEAELMLYRRGYKAPYWRAPELLRGDPPSKATDVYAYGMLLYEVLYRREPFEKENKEVSYRNCISHRLLPDQYYIALLTAVIPLA